MLNVEIECMLNVETKCCKKNIFLMLSCNVDVKKKSECCKWFLNVENECWILKTITKKMIKKIEWWMLNIELTRHKWKKLYILGRLSYFLKPVSLERYVSIGKLLPT